jgi:DNA-binding transcriptional ArsR family regulator
MEEVLAAIADPTRRRMLELLADRERSVGELVDRFTLSQPAVSGHLRVLRDAGLVDVRRDGARRVHSLRPQALAGVAEWIARLS